MIYDDWFICAAMLWHFRVWYLCMIVCPAPHRNNISIAKNEEKKNKKLFSIMQARTEYVYINIHSNTYLQLTTAEYYYLK